MKITSLFRAAQLMAFALAFIHSAQAQNRSNDLTGTYRLDPIRSDNPAAVADRVARTLPGDQQRLRDTVARRLEAPDSLALEISGKTVTMSSSKGAQVTFDADGRSQTEVSPNGRMQRTIATLANNRLTISTAGDRSLDYQLNLDLVDNGRSLRVTRSVTDEALQQPVVARSFYQKTSPTAQWDFHDRTSGESDARDSSRRNDRGVFVPEGTLFDATLNDKLSTNLANEGDHFTLNVISPPSYNGATIEGHVDRVKRSGAVAGRAEMALNFDRIRLPDGSSGDFQAYIDSVSTPNGETVLVDREGQLQDTTSQTDRTTTRTGIGAAIGAVIGAIAGGGKGAAIGAAAGAGAGAGSVLVQGRDDLSLTGGTRFRIRSILPRDSSQQ